MFKEVDVSIRLVKDNKLLENIIDITLPPETTLLEICEFLKMDYSYILSGDIQKCICFSDLEKRYYDSLDEKIGCCYKKQSLIINVDGKDIILLLFHFIYGIMFIQNSQINYDLNNPQILYKDINLCEMKPQDQFYGKYLISWPNLTVEIYNNFLWIGTLFLEFSPDITLRDVGSVVEKQYADSLNGIMSKISKSGFIFHKLKTAIQKKWIRPDQNKCCFKQGCFIKNKKDVLNNGSLSYTNNINNKNNQLINPKFSRISKKCDIGLFIILFINYVLNQLVVSNCLKYRLTRTMEKHTGNNLAIKLN